MRLIINRLSLLSAFKFGCLITMFSTICLGGPFILAGIFIFAWIEALLRPLVSPADFALLSNTFLGRSLLLVATVGLAGVSGGIAWATSALLFNIAARIAGGFTLFIKRPPRRPAPQSEPASQFELADDKLEKQFMKRARNVERAEDFEAALDKAIRS